MRFSGLAVTTDVSGTFMFSVPGGGEARAITVELPTGQYFNYGEQRGQCLENISGAGITVAKSDLEVGDQTDVGEIRVFSADGPPPPPCKF